jgi:hypothetical protein
MHGLGCGHSDTEDGSRNQRDDMQAGASHGLSPLPHAMQRAFTTGEYLRLTIVKRAI